MRLALRREALTELTGDDLLHVVGGAPTTDCVHSLRCIQEMTPYITKPTI